MQEYMLVSQERMLIELHRWRGDEWQVEILTAPEESCMFESVGLAPSIGDIYRNVRLTIISEVVLLCHQASSHVRADRGSVCKP